MRPNIPHAHIVDFCVLSTSGISLTLLLYKQVCVNKVRRNKFKISYIKKLKSHSSGKMKGREQLA